MAKSNASRSVATATKSKAAVPGVSPATAAHPAEGSGAPLGFAEIRELLQLVQSLGLEEVVIRNPHQVVRVVGKRPVVYAAAVAAAAGAPSGSGGVVAPVADHASTGAAPIAAGEAPAPPKPSDNPNWKRITAPMVGTFYRSPSPEAGSFVQVGDRVDEESVLCIIEAMKLMNEIKAEMRGTIREIVAENGRPVEYGQPMFIIEPA